MTIKSGKNAVLRIRDVSEFKQWVIEMLRGLGGMWTVTDEAGEWRKCLRILCLYKKWTFSAPVLF